MVTWTMIHSVFIHIYINILHIIQQLNQCSRIQNTLDIFSFFYFILTPSFVTSFLFPCVHLLLNPVWVFYSLFTFNGCVNHINELQLQLLILFKKDASLFCDLTGWGGYPGWRWQKGLWLFFCLYKSEMTGTFYSIFFGTCGYNVCIFCLFTAGWQRRSRSSWKRCQLT